MAAKVYHAIGKRKSAIARVYLTSGDGQITVNEKDCGKYFPAFFQSVVKQPLTLLKADAKYNIRANILGGGPSAQAQALRHGIARALCIVSDSNRPHLKKAHLLTRDARVVERKKYGHKKARRSFQFSKR